MRHVKWKNAEYFSSDSRGGSANPKKALSAVSGTVRDILWPEGAVCLSCGKISDGESLCPACRKSLRSMTGSSWTRQPADGLEVWSLRRHQGVARDLVLKLKHGTTAVAAEDLLETVLPLPEGVSFSSDTVVTWVTMPASRLLERGIDHGRLLAEGVADRLGLSCRPLLNRADSRMKPQVILNEKERRRNLVGVFTARERLTCPVLLVDDVFTTGTTASRCAEVLKEAGATRITVLTFTY